MKVAFFGVAAGVLAGTCSATAAEQEKPVSLSANGVQVGSAHSWGSMQINGRLQSRYSSEFPDRPRTINDFLLPETDKFYFPRSRIKLKGHVGASWLTYAVDYELDNGYVLDYVVTLAPQSSWSLKAGQWKIEYSRERASGTSVQQMLDRSVLDAAFSLDRQQAITVQGRMNKGEVSDVQYWLGIGSGTGRGGQFGDAGGPLWFARTQWNPTGQPVGFVYGDLKRHASPALSVAVAAATVSTPFSRFSSAGGRQLPDWPADLTGHNHIDQYTADIAYMYQGLNFTAEWHRKTVTQPQFTSISLEGAYVQAGYFVHEWLPGWPQQLELAGRVAAMVTTADRKTRLAEQGMALNYYFNGYANKLTLDVTRYDHESGDVNADTLRGSLQWEVTF